MGEPARGYSWPPFQKGHELSTRHGAHSPRRIRPIADRLAAELAEVAPWSAGPVFAAEVEAWAWAEARCRLLREWLDEHALLDEEGEPRGALGELHRAESTAAKARERLGLSPAAWSKLLAAYRDLEGTEGRTAVQLRDVGRQILEARQAGDDTVAAELVAGDDEGDHDDNAG